MVRKAIEAGWTEDDIEQALLSLSVAYMRQNQCDAQNYERMRRAAGTVEGE